MNSRKILEMYLGFLARMVLVRCSPRIVAITGTVGKTTTTAAIYQALVRASNSLDKKEVVTNYKRNMNDTVGVPITILGGKSYIGIDARGLQELFRLSLRALLLMVLGQKRKTYVLECGISRPGEMVRLARMLRPDISVVTAIGPAHLENGMRNSEDVAEQKGYLVEYTKPGGVAILGNNDNDYLDEMASRATSKIIEVNGRGSNLSVNAALAVVRHLGLDDNDLETALQDFSGPANRMDAKECHGLRLIDDSFNANPLSMKLALDTLRDSPCKGKKVAILGGMAELGDKTKEYHEELGRYAIGCADHIVAVGEFGKLYGVDDWFPSSSECAVHVWEFLRSSDLVLVKGSKIVGMKNIVDAVASGPSGKCNAG